MIWQWTCVSLDELLHFRYPFSQNLILVIVETAFWLIRVFQILGGYLTSLGRIGYFLTAQILSWLLPLDDQWITVWILSIVFWYIIGGVFKVLIGSIWMAIDMSILHVWIILLVIQRIFHTVLSLQFSRIVLLDFAWF